MKKKKFVAKNFDKALLEIQKIFGDDALILEYNQLNYGVEIIAGIEQSEQDILLENNTNQNKTDSNTNDDLKEEIKSLRYLIEEQLPDSSFKNSKKKNAVKTYMIRKLLSLGFSMKFAQIVVNIIPEDASIACAIEKVKSYLSEQITIKKESNLNTNIRAFVGPSGCGKTSLITRLLTQYISYAKVNTDIAVVSIASNKIGECEKLKTCCNILDIPLTITNDIDELNAILFDLRDKKYIYIDTPSANLSLDKDNSIVSNLKSCDFKLKITLVLPLNLQRKMIERYIVFWLGHNLCDVAISKVDESLSFGEMLTPLISYGVPISYLLNGDNVLEQVNFFDKEKIINKLFVENKLKNTLNLK